MFNIRKLHEATWPLQFLLSPRVLTVWLKPELSVSWFPSMWRHCCLWVGNPRTAVVFLGIQGAGRVCEVEEEASTCPTLSTHVLEGHSEDHYWRARVQEGLPSLHPGGNKKVNRVLESPHSTEHLFWEAMRMILLMKRRWISLTQSSTHLLIYFFIQHLLSVSHVPGTVLVTGDDGESIPFTSFSFIFSSLLLHFSDPLLYYPFLPLPQRLIPSS